MIELHAQHPLVFVIYCTAIYYVLARAEGTRWLWTRYRGGIDRLARCPACAGFWIGALLNGSLAFGAPPRQIALAAAIGAAWGVIGVAPVTWLVLRTLTATKVPPPKEKS